MSSPNSPSKIAIEKLRYLDVPANPSDLTVSMENGLAGLRETFGQLLEDDPRWSRTGTVLTAMLWQDIHAVIAQVGDTRAYMLRHDELTQLTQDHTIGQVLLDEGHISPSELKLDSKYSAVTRWLGGESSEPADIVSQPRVSAAPGVILAGAAAH